MKRSLVAFFLILLLLFPLFAIEVPFDELPEGNSEEFLKEILISDIPVTYGDESFRARILERTEGKRDPIGLVLTGGSARACAHIGVLRYLDDNGIEPDFIVSNSMGSIIGLLYAAGVSPDQIENVMLSGDISSYFALTLPSHGGFLDASGFRTLIDSVVGKDYRLEETKIPCMVVCDDLVSKREIRITEGDFTDILVGSFALPVYFPPYEYNGHLLVDGGVISLAPISAAYDYTDTVILSTTFYDAIDMNLINPVSILNVSFDIGKRQNASTDLKKHYDDMIWIRCAVENFSFMAFSKTSEMAEIGYESAALEGEKLNALYKTAHPVLGEEDVEMSEKIRDITENLKFFGRIKTSKPSSMLTANFYSMDNNKSTEYYLKNTMMMGIEYKYLISNFDMRVVGGIGVDAQNLASSDSFPSAGFQVFYYPVNNMRFGLESYVDILRHGAAFSPLFYGRESIDWFVAYEKNWDLSLHEAAEYSNDFSHQLGKALLGTAYFKGNYLRNNVSLRGDIGYLFTSESHRFENFRQYGQVTLGGRYDINSHVFFDASSRIRFCLDKGKSVPLFINDRFVSNSNGYGATAIYRESALFNFINNLTFGYRFGGSPTFGEFLILEKPVLGLFASVLSCQGGVDYTFGVEMETVASLIGLIKLPISLKIGCEVDQNKMVSPTASMVFSSTF